MKTKFSRLIVVAAFLASAHVASALQCIHVPAGKAEAPATGGTDATIVDIAASATAASRRVVQFSDTGTPAMAFRVFAPGNEWTASANDNELVPKILVSCANTGTATFTVECTANTAATAWSSGGTSTPQITGTEGTATTHNITIISADTTSVDGATGALAVFDAGATIDCVGTTCQNKELTCVVTRNDALSGICTIPSFDLCY